MKLSWILAAILMVASAPNLPAQPKDQCLSCHTDIGDPIAQKYANDIHRKKGVSCAGCHGGDSSQQDIEAAMNPKKGFIGVPKGTAVVDTCLQCHADLGVMSKYHSSIDVTQFQQFPSSVHGQADIATCVSCHGVHEIRSPKDPQSPVYPTREVLLCSHCHSDVNYMKTFNPALPTDQYEKYKTSIHGRRLERGDTKVATCSSCHGTHVIFRPKDPRSSVYALNVPKTCAKCHSDVAYMKPYGIPTDQYLKYASSVHGEALLKKRDTSAPACNDCHGNHGAAPPGVLSISHVCGECHALNAEYFSKSPHLAAFEQSGIPQCEVCHENHKIQAPTDEMLHVGNGSVCETCHPKSESYASGYAIAQQMYLAIQKLKDRAVHADVILKEAEEKGMDVSDARFKTKDIPGALIKARTVTHTADLSEFNKQIDVGQDLAQQATVAGEKAIEEYYFRRRWLGVSTLFITLLVVALYLKIRQIESK